jgi:uncharacterized alpha-E superfamily protein
VLLQVADSSTAYRSRYLASIRTRYVLELLLTDDSNPRSVAFQAAALLEGVQSLPRPQTETTLAPEYVAAKRLRQLLGEASMDEIKRRDANGERLALEAHLQTIRNGVTDLSDALTARYLSHSAPSRLRAI